MIQRIPSEEESQEMAKNSSISPESDSGVRIETPAETMMEDSGENRNTDLR